MKFTRRTAMKLFFLARAALLSAAAACLIFASAPVARAEDPAPLKAGAAASNVTPWLGVSIAGQMHDRTAAHIHDELFARAIVLEEGKTRLAFVVVDSCMIPREPIDEAKRRIEKAAQIPPSHVLISATHTHTAAASASVFQSDPDPKYVEFLVGRIVDAVIRAVNQLEPAKIAFGSAQVPDQVFNRRWHTKPGVLNLDPFGKTTDKVKMNPPAGSPDITDPAGPTDPEAAFFYVQSAGGRPIALLANYSLHYVGGEGPNHISADYFGMFAEDVAELLGAEKLDPPFVGIMTNGTSANCNNIDFRVKGEPKQPYEQMRAVAARLAGAVHDTCGKLEFKDRVRLAAAARDLEFAVRKPSAEEAEAARAVVKEAGEKMISLQQIYARETALIADFPDRVSVPLQALRIGELGIAAIPCEVFVEIGLEIKAKSPLQPSFTIELANGYNGYLPTPEHHALGGYETWRARSSYLETGAAPKITEAVLSLLGEAAAQ